MLTRMRRNRDSHSLLVGMQNDIATLKEVWQFPTKIYIFLSHNPAITHLGIYPNQMKAYAYTKTCTCMLTAGLSLPKPGSN